MAKYAYITKCIEKLKLITSFPEFVPEADELMAAMHTGALDSLLGKVDTESGMLALPVAILAEKLEMGKSSIEKVAEAQKKQQQKQAISQEQLVCIQLFHLFFRSLLVQLQYFCFQIYFIFIP